MFDENLLKAETYAIQEQLGKIGVSAKSFSAKTEAIEDDIISTLREELHGIQLVNESNEEVNSKKESLIRSMNETIGYLKSLGDYEHHRIYFQIEFNEDIGDKIEILDKVVLNAIIPALKMSLVALT